MNRRSALKAMSGAAAMCLLGANFLKEKGFPVAKFEDRTQKCPERLRSILGEGSTITQPRLVNGDEILGGWLVDTEPHLDFDAALSEQIDFFLPHTIPCLTRTNLVFINPKDGFRIFTAPPGDDIENNELVKICGAVRLTQVRWHDMEITGVNAVDRTWRIRQSEEEALKELGLPTT